MSLYVVASLSNVPLKTASFTLKQHFEWYHMSEAKIGFQYKRQSRLTLLVNPYFCTIMYVTDSRRHIGCQKPHVVFILL
jgi:hypothetical protein